MIRHGQAASTAPGGSDAERPLTDAGRRALAGVGRGLCALRVGWERLLVSPLPRARETAGILAAEVGGPEPETLAALAPGGDPQRILAELAGSGERVALVGHQPTLGELVALAVAGVGSSGVALGTGAVARLEFSGAPRPGAGRLRWLLAAEQLARLGA